MFDAKTEGRAESSNRVWRRWSCFCKESLGGESPLLDGIPPDKADLFFLSFLEMYRESDFSTKGSYTRKRKRPMVGSTIAEAARTLVKTLWGHHGRRPFYHPESSSKSGFSTNIRDLMRGRSVGSTGRGRQLKIQLRMTAHPTTLLLTESFLPSPSLFQPISKSHTFPKK